MSTVFPVTVYPSQLDSFKRSADLLATAISNITQSQKLSAFKRNDYLSEGIGYKNHSALIQAAKFRAQADTGTELDLFSDTDITDSIARAFTSKLDYLTVPVMNKAIQQVKDSELISTCYEKDIMLGLSVEDSIMNGRAAYAMKPWLDSMREMEERHAPRRSCPHITINIEEAPLDVAHMFTGHPKLRSFLSEKQNFNCKKGKLSINWITQCKAFNKENKNWKIRVSIDAWGTPEMSDIANWQPWQEFKTWLSSFYATERIRITERIDSHRTSTIVTQYHPSITLKDVRGKLDSTADRLLFDSLSAELDVDYSHVFSCEPADVSFDEIIKSKDKDIVTIDVNAASQSEVGRLVLKNIFDTAKHSQESEINAERDRLQAIIKENPGTKLIDHCPHKVKDEIGKDTGTKCCCLVCGLSWQESTYDFSTQVHSASKEKSMLLSLLSPSANMSHKDWEKASRKAMLTGSILNKSVKAIDDQQSTHQTSNYSGACVDTDPKHLAELIVDLAPAEDIDWTLVGQKLQGAKKDRLIAMTKKIIEDRKNISAEFISPRSNTKNY